MGTCCDLEVDINGEETFMVNKVKLFFSNFGFLNEMFDDYYTLIL